MIIFFSSHKHIYFCSQWLKSTFQYLWSSSSVWSLDDPSYRKKSFDIDLQQSEELVLHEWAHNHGECLQRLCTATDWRVSCTVLFVCFSEELKQYFFVASVSKTSEQFQMLLRLTSCQLFWKTNYFASQTYFDLQHFGYWKRLVLRNRKGLLCENTTTVGKHKQKQRQPKPKLIAQRSLLIQINSWCTNGLVEKVAGETMDLLLWPKEKKYKTCAILQLNSKNKVLQITRTPVSLGQCFTLRECKIAIYLLWYFMPNSTVTNSLYLEIPIGTSSQ